MKIKIQVLGTPAGGDVLDMIVKIHSAEIQYTLTLTCSFPLPFASNSTPSFGHSTSSVYPEPILIHYFHPYPRYHQFLPQ